LGGDFNGHIITRADGYVLTHGGYGYGVRNEGGVALLDFAVAYDLVIVNSLFQKKADHLVPFRSGNTKTQIDFFLTRAGIKGLCKDCKVIPSEQLGTQHRLLVMDVAIKRAKVKKRLIGEPKVRWWNLIRENAVRLIEKIIVDGNLRRLEDVDQMWEALVGCIRESAKEVLGISRGGGNRLEGAWWWNDEVTEKVKDKQYAYATLMECRTEEEKEIFRIKYKDAKKVAKKAVALAKNYAFERFYRTLETKEGKRPSSS